MECSNRPLSPFTPPPRSTCCTSYYSRLLSLIAKPPTMSTSRTPKQIFPSEILLLIGTILEREDQKETLSSLVRASRTSWKLLTPLLYRSINVPFRSSLVGLMENFSPRSGPSATPNLYQETRRGLHLLDMIKELTLDAIPKVIKISTLLPLPQSGMNS